jgi:GWxTD domain-containing protein
MKKFFFILLTMLLSVGLSFTKASMVKAYLAYATFNSAEYGPYFETYLSVWGKSINYIKNQQGKYQGKLAITMLFKQDNIIKNYKKYEFLTPELDNLASLDINFIDQQRFVLPNGNYNFELILADANGDSIPLYVTQPIVIDFPLDTVSTSGIQLIESYSKATEPTIKTKSGYDLIPHVSNFYSAKTNTITFYSEIYNTDKILGADQKYLINWFIESFENGKVLNDYSYIKKETAKGVNVILGEFDISKLPSGNYNLGIEVHNRENAIIASNRLFFQRSNPNIQIDMKDVTNLNITNTFVLNITNRDSLTEYIRSLGPISSEIEKSFVNNQLASADLTTLQQYFYNFWKSRNSTDPTSEWKKYKAEIDKVNNSFSTPIKKGYDTDCGRVYLQYGPPNTIVDKSFEASPGLLDDANGAVNKGTVPYQIWHYYKVKNQSNVKFVFYNPHFLGNELTLLHSNAIGEISNYNWQHELFRQIRTGDSEDVMSPSNRYFGRSGEEWNNPY